MIVSVMRIKTILFRDKYGGRGGRSVLKRRWGTARAYTLLVQGIGFLDQVNPGSYTWSCKAELSIFLSILVFNYLSYENHLIPLL